MKKRLSILTAFGLSATLSSSLVACSWKIPPFSVKEITQIMEIIKNTSTGSNGDILPMLGQSSIDKTAVEKLKDSKDKNTEARNIADGLTNNINAIILDSIKNKKDLAGNDISDQLMAFDNDTIQKFAPHYFTVSFADIKYDKQWLSQKSVEFINEVMFKNEQGENKKKLDLKETGINNIPNDSHLAKKQYVSTAAFTELDAFLNENGKLENNFEEVLFLVSINPDVSQHAEAKPVAFYVGSKI